jgi:hypothetical protein
MAGTISQQPENLTCIMIFGRVYISIYFKYTFVIVYCNYFTLKFGKVLTLHIETENAASNTAKTKNEGESRLEKKQMCVSQAFEAYIRK